MTVNKPQIWKKEQVEVNYNSKCLPWLFWSKGWAETYWFDTDDVFDVGSAKKLHILHNVGIRNWN